MLIRTSSDIFREKLSGEENLEPHEKPGHQFPRKNSTTKRENLEINSRDTAEHRRSTTNSRRLSHADEPHVKPRRNQRSDSDSDGNERRHVATKHEDAIEGETSDTDDYETDHSDDSVRGERPTPSP